MLSPLVGFLGQLLGQALLLAPILVGFALFLYGAILALGNHQRGREGIICALVGGAVMLTSQQIGAALHP